MKLAGGPAHCRWSLGDSHPGKWLSLGALAHGQRAAACVRPGLGVNFEVPQVQSSQIPIPHQRKSSPDRNYMGCLAVLNHLSTAILWGLPCTEMVYFLVNKKICSCIKLNSAVVMNTFQEEFRSPCMCVWRPGESHCGDSNPHTQRCTFPALPFASLLVSTVLPCPPLVIVHEDTATP